MLWYYGERSDAKVAAVGSRVMPRLRASDVYRSDRLQFASQGRWETSELVAPRCRAIAADEANSSIDSGPR